MILNLSQHIIATLEEIHPPQAYRNPDDGVLSISHRLQNLYIDAFLGKAKILAQSDSVADLSLTAIVSPIVMP